MISLVAPLILDLAIFAELLTRIQYRFLSSKDGDNESQFESFHSVLSLLSFFLKAPMVKPGAPVINSFNKQRAAIENLLRACLGLDPVNELNMEHRMK